MSFAQGEFGLIRQAEFPTHDGVKTLAINSNNLAAGADSLTNNAKRRSAILPRFLSLLSWNHPGYT